MRPACADDVPAIYKILENFATKRLLLPRPQLDILMQIESFTVAVAEDGQVAGCAALRDYGNDLYEVRSLAVSENFQRLGIASKMVSAQMESLKGKKTRLFALTYRADFFQTLGFQIVDKTMFPEKIWSDCERCPKKDRCDETAVFLELV